jgi:hypothetical protein
MMFDNLDDWEQEVASLPPEDETEARDLAMKCTEAFSRPLPAEQPRGQTRLDFGQQEPLF